MLALLLAACAPAFVQTIEDNRAALQSQEPALLREADWGGTALRYVDLGPPDAPPVVFVHGSPGSWDAYAHLLRDPGLQGYRRLAYDRPGFGGSAPGREEPSLARQAEALATVLDAAGVREPVRLVGHSLGGAVIARFAIDHPERTAGLVFVASSVDPSLEKRLWYQKAAELRLIQWMIPADFITANREIAPLGGELEAMLPLWSRITAPVAIVHAHDDGLVPIQNVSFLERMLGEDRPRETLIDEGGHAILWTRPELVVSAIRGLDGG